MATERVIPLLLRVAHRVRRRHEDACATHGLTFQQFNVLRILAGAERAGDPGLPTMEIHARLLEPGAGITRFVKQLAGLGLIETFRPASDQRRQEVRLTPAGRARLAELAPAIAAEAEAELAGLDAAGRARLGELLGRMLANCS